MWLRLGLLCLALGVVGAFDPPEVEAQTRRVRSSRRSRSSTSSTRTRGRTRRVRSQRSRRRARRRYRRRLRINGPRFDRRDCDWVDDGYCYLAANDGYYSPGGAEFGFSVDAAGGVYWAGGPNRLSTPRTAQDIDGGLLGIAGASLRLWAGYDRLRIGGIVFLGRSMVVNSSTLPTSGALEEGTSLTGGAQWAVAAFAAYQPQVSDWLSLSLGLRVGVSLTGVGFAVLGRHYDAAQRTFGTVGPEIGLIFTGTAGVGFGAWLFADALQPGHVLLSVGFVYDGPHPLGAHF